MSQIQFIERGGMWVAGQIALMLIVFTVPTWLGTPELTLEHPISFAGAILTTIAVLVIGWGLSSLGSALTPFPKPLADVTLRRQGAYRFMRHPIYAGIILAGFGWALWWLSMAGVLGAVVLAIFFDRKAIQEEQWLRQQYPDYAEYSRLVKRFLPGVY